MGWHTWSGERTLCLSGAGASDRHSGRTAGTLWRTRHKRKGRRGVRSICRGERCNERSIHEGACCARRRTWHMASTARETGGSLAFTGTTPLPDLSGSAPHTSMPTLGAVAPVSREAANPEAAPMPL
eukprot:scaffold46886_cov28-Tisochrysis_lutea.AAC.4